ncbi:hypothetical protein LJR290_007451 [Variovorax sp. LjRoot290]|uniref:hypothetical protein n=1 Tax=Variovorax sp. LjRoot290 TaxID=3342316 RepID=UPI003ECDBABA
MKPLVLIVLLALWHPLQANAFGCDPPPPSVVLMYSGMDYQGRCSAFDQSVSNLTGTWVGNDAARSIRIVGDRVAILYRNAEFSGRRSVFTRSDSSLHNNRIGLATASSLRVLKTNCDGRVGVYLHEHRNHNGRCTKFRGDARLDETYIQSDVASSMSMIGLWSAALFRTENQVGPAFRSEGRSARDLGNAFNDNTKSIRVTPRHAVCNGRDDGVYLYSGTNFTGECTRFTSSEANLNSWRVGAGTASSIRVIGPYSGTVYYRATRVNEVASTFSSDDPNFFDDDIGPDNATGIRVTGPETEQAPILRAQIRITTADVEDAGTDDSVLVSLNEGNETWLDYGAVQNLATATTPSTLWGGDDFERNSVYTYDLLLDGVSTAGDIKWLVLSKTGSDGLCVKSIELLINGHDTPAFSKDFGRCVSLDNEGSHERSIGIGFEELRSRRWEIANLSTNVLVQGAVSSLKRNRVASVD